MTICKPPPTKHTKTKRPYDKSGLFQQTSAPDIQQASMGPTSEEIRLLVTLFNQGLYAEAEALARHITARFPEHGFGWKVLGAVLKSLGRTADSLEPMLKASILLPGHADAHSNLGITLKNLGRLEEAEASYRRALEIKPDFAEAHSNLGVTLKCMGRLAEAEASYRRALEINPDFSEIHGSLGLTLYDLGRLAEAETCYRRALALNPCISELHCNLGVTLEEQGRLQEAEACYRRALEIKPDFSEAHNNLGNTLKDQGRLEEAETSYRLALEIKPHYAEAHSNLLFCLTYSPAHTTSLFLEEALRYGRLVSKIRGGVFNDWSCKTAPERLRIGIVSGDLRNHPVGYFLESLLKQLDQTRVELIAFPTFARSDDLTHRIKPYFAAWKPIYGLDDQNAADLIHSTGVNVLLDISGHSAFNRLPVFAWKPAPVQVSWIGFLATTGVNEIDYILGDSLATPPEDKGNFSEELWRLPETYCCFTPPDVTLEVGPLPALSAGFITFASFNHLSKMTENVVVLWARILMTVPGSRLFLKTKSLDDPTVRKTIVKRFAALGIESKQLLLEGASPRTELLAAYQRVDIALDPFPYNGATTSAESLWMAVPFITRKGDRFISRCGQSIAYNAGLADWIAENDDDYVAKAVTHASDLIRLASLRSRLRQQILASPLFDATRFARHLEAALWGMWKRRENAFKPVQSSRHTPALLPNNVAATTPLKRVLCIEAANWVGIERLPIHLSESGFDVGCLCSDKSVLNKISCLSCYNWILPGNFDYRLEEVIMGFKPDLLIFMDEYSIGMVSRIIALNPRDILSRHRKLLEKSLGNLKTVADRILRRSLMSLQESVRIPKTLASRSLIELLEFGASVNWKAFFKAEFTCSGMGVISTESEQLFLETSKQLLHEGKQFIVQESIRGITAMRAAVAYEGKILCGISFNKIMATAGGIGYSTVVMATQQEEMKATTEKIGELLKINGPFSCDFIVDNDTGAAYLIEINPRPTTVFHLGHLFGVSFASSFGAIIDGTTQIQNDNVLGDKEIALFPKELFRDSKSPKLTTAMHDVPWEYPEVVAHYISMIAGENKRA